MSKKYQKGTRLLGYTVQITPYAYPPRSHLKKLIKGSNSGIGDLEEQKKNKVYDTLAIFFFFIIFQKPPFHVKSKGIRK